MVTAFAAAYYQSLLHFQLSPSIELKSRSGILVAAMPKHPKGGSVSSQETGTAAEAWPSDESSSTGRVKAGC